MLCNRYAASGLAGSSGIKVVTISSPRRRVLDLAVVSRISSATRMGRMSANSKGYAVRGATIQTYPLGTGKHFHLGKISFRRAVR